MGMLDLANRHQSTKDAARWLEPNDRLDTEQRDIAVVFAELAQRLLAKLADSPELTLCLRELTCAKDNAVRASIAADGGRLGWSALRG